LFSSEVPASRLLDENLGISERVIITEKRPLVRFKRQLTLWTSSKKIDLLAILLQRDKNEHPRSHKVLGRRLVKCRRGMAGSSDALRIFEAKA
jgi:hypothetical protein